MCSRRKIFIINLIKKVIVIKNVRGYIGIHKKINTNTGIKVLIYLTIVIPVP